MSFPSSARRPRPPIFDRATRSRGRRGRCQSGIRLNLASSASFAAPRPVLRTGGLGGLNSRPSRSRDESRAARMGCAPDLPTSPGGYASQPEAVEATRRHVARAPHRSASGCASVSRLCWRMAANAHLRTFTSWPYRTKAADNAPRRTRGERDHRECGPCRYWMRSSIGVDMDGLANRSHGVASRKQQDEPASQ